MPRIILGLYLIIGLVHVVTRFYDFESVNAYTKPFLMPLLIYYIYRYAEGHITLPRLLLVGALIFSWIGDLLLMGDGDLFFMGGLASFLVAQVIYAVVLYRSTFHRPQIKPLYLLPFLGYAMVLLSFLLPHAGEMGVAIIVYAIGILSMAYLAFLRKGLTTESSFYLVMTGAVLFVISDSIIAIDKFYQPIPRSGAIIMTTYMLAQLMLVSGVLRHQD